MRHTRLKFTAVFLSAAALAACDGGTILEPAADGARFTDNQCPPGEVCWEEPPGDTTSVPMVAEFRRVSTAYAGTDVEWKKVRMYALSESIRYVASSSLDATFRHYKYGCLSNSYTPPQVAHVTRYGNGSPLKLEAAYAVQYPKNYYNTFQVNSAHSFTPIPGATGGGNFTTAFRGCY